VKRPKIVTFLSDFGWDGGYVGACEGVIASINPSARIAHISHDIGVGDVAGGALILARVCKLYPPAAHLAVVDPGVGTARQPIVITTERTDVLIGPDNGLLLAAAESLGGMSGAWLIDPRQMRAKGGLAQAAISSTFHGRDIFAPAAALISQGLEPEICGRALEPSSLVRLEPPHWRVHTDGANADVIEIDRFGNVGLALPFDEFLPRPEILAVEIDGEGEGSPEWTARVVNTYGELRPGELGLLRDSWGQVALALNGASAAELLSVRRGMSVRVARRGDRA
jgi:S-adenosylmethionine hydrolase